MLAALRPFLESETVAKLGHNLKFDYSVLVSHGVALRGPLHDSMIASYLLDPSRRTHKLDDLCEMVLSRRLTSFGEVTDNDKRPDSFAYVELQKYVITPVRMSAAPCSSGRALPPNSRNSASGSLYTDIEMELVPILALMERNGILLDPQILSGMSSEFEEKIADLEEQIYRLAGHAFNINSPRQLGEILFDELGLPHGRKTKTGYSTDAKVLEKLALQHELPATVIVHRNISKLKSTYVDKLAGLINPQTGRVHTSFNQTITATGRLSSSNPNLQNIPIRTEEGQRIRQAAIAPQAINSSPPTIRRSTSGSWPTTLRTRPFCKRSAITKTSTCAPPPRSSGSTPPLSPAHAAGGEDHQLRHCLRDERFWPLQPGST